MIQVRNRKIYFYGFLLIGLMLNQLHAQSINKSLNDVAMPSANAVAFGKYGDIPVGHFTGVPNISIPITTIQEGTLSLPISLSYHASGIKVAELASWVGLGWNLNFGGQISRSVIGFPDESIHTRRMGYLQGGSRVSNQLAASIAGNHLENTNFSSLDEKDLEPDIFSFTAGNYSGKFYIDNERDVVLIPQQDLNVSFEFGLNGSDTIISAFTIVTPEGNRYLYGMDVNNPNITAYEKSTPKLRPSDNRATYETIQVWHLLKIEDYTRNFWISFSYAPEQYQYPTLSSEMVGFEMTGNGGERFYQNRGELIQFDRVAPALVVNVTHVSLSQRLEQITTSSNFTTVNFGGINTREDLKFTFGDMPAIHIPLPTQLDWIDIQTSAGERYAKRFELNYDYWIDHSVEPVADAVGYNKRLRLLSIAETAPNAIPAETLPPYQFEYQGDNSYPNRLSKQYDHWGFYNGTQPYISERLTYEGVNRSPNELYMKQGVLSKITYPTGGYTSFNFEANKVQNGNSDVLVGGLRIRQIISNTGMPLAQDMITNYNYSNGINDFSSGLLMITPRYSDTVIAYLDRRRPNSANNLRVGYIFFSVSNSPVVPLSDFTGYHIGYRRVLEEKVGNGKIIYEFYQEDPNGLDTFVYGGAYPNVCPPPRVKTGQLKALKIKDASNNLIHQIDNEWYVGYSNNGHACRHKKVIIINANNAEHSSNPSVNLEFLSSYPLIKPTFMRLLKKTEMKDGITTVTDNEYNNFAISGTY